MKDNLFRLQKSINNSISIQEQMIEFLLQDSDDKERKFIFREFEAESGTKMPEKKIIKLSKENQEQKIILFNSLASKRVDVISLYVSEVNVKIIDENGSNLQYQINPVFQDGRIVDVKKLLIHVDLPALSLTVLKVVLDKNEDTDAIADVITDFEDEAPFIENPKMRLIFNETSGFLRQIYFKNRDEMYNTEIHFSGYKSTNWQSGAYLFKPEGEDKSLFSVFSQTRIIVIKGRIASDIIVFNSDLLTQAIRLYNTGTHLDNAISIVNEIDFGSEDKNRNIELIMKVKTSINNSKNGEPEFFTDENGFQWQPRRKVSKLGIEGNYYPITTSMFIQDDSMRLTLMTTHAQGATSFQKGELEVMLDRRTGYDDSRGMCEGVLDSVKMQHKFLLTFEFFETVQSTENYQVPSLFVHHIINLLNHPVNMFHVDNKIDIRLHNQIELFNYQFPCDVNLINLRSITHNELDWIPSDSALLIMHRMGHDCQLTNENFLELICSKNNEIRDYQITKFAKIRNVQEASLTGLKINNNIKSFHHSNMKPMEIKTYYVTFS
ncbi:alpha-mannosidase 2-like [Chironomus tepperi]|uniref:alpha-mannosidase 2-like n=1 Tax=Chironomus tepperi TaxID=113505 RepID=UPI00391F9C6A